MSRAARLAWLLLCLASLAGRPGAWGVVLGAWWLGDLILGAVLE